MVYSLYNAVDDSHIMRYRLADIDLNKYQVEGIGIGKERVHHDWISASEGEKFSTAVNMMVNRIKDLGPAPLKDQLNAEG
mgnify:CR=1 FL=1